MPGTGHDQLNVEHDANLSGTLNLEFINGFLPDPCQTFEIITYGSRSGTDPTVNVSGLPVGWGARVVYGATSAIAVVYNAAVPINVHPTTVSVTEGGADAEYHICLATATPPADTSATVVTVPPGGSARIADSW